MALHVTVLGIDGSGKSTVTAALPPLVAGSLGVRAGTAGDGLCVADPEQDRVGACFAFDGLPLVARLARVLRRLAKALTTLRVLYPIIKVAHLVAQDAAAWRIARRYRVDVMVSDGNAVLSTLGRAANHGWSERLRRVRAALLRRRRLPDVAVFLDLPPEEALERVRQRGRALDPHENLADLTEARRGYLETLAAFAEAHPEATVLILPVSGLTPGQCLRRILTTIRERLAASPAPARAPEADPLGTSTQTQKRLWLRLMGPRYVFGYLLPWFFRGAWRELTFLFSRTGRVFLQLGYSAEVMRLIYEEEGRERWLDRVFHGYPLHRAVFDRLQILARRVQPEIERRLIEGRSVRILTGPSGFAYDLLRPLEALAPLLGLEAMKRVEIVATDLDPHGAIGPALEAAAARLGFRVRFQAGDLTDDQTRARLEAHGPYDLALFVGVSSWLPKPATLSHLVWASRVLRADGLLISDCFTPHGYTISGHLVGYRAQYYAPEVYRALVDASGFDGTAAVIESGRDRINHVLVAPVRASNAKQRLAA